MSRQKHIVIIELAKHFEVARSYAKMFLHFGYKVSIATTKSNYTFLSPFFKDEMNWLIKETEKESSNDFLKTNSHHLDSSDFVLCCTPEDSNGEVISKSWKTKSFLCVHDANNYFNYKNNIDFKGGLKQWLRIVKYFVTSYFSKRIIGLKSFDNVIVPSTLIKNYLETKNQNIKVVALPFLWNEYLGKPINITSPIKIVIPGTVKLRSRNYEQVLKVFSKINRDILSDTELVLLGKYSNSERDLIIAYENLSNTILNVKAYEAFVDAHHYEEVMVSADLLLLPLNIEWKYGIVGETGGTTCLSGNIGDMVRYGKISLIPSNYKLQDEIKELVVSYENEEDLGKKILSFINKKENEVKQKNNWQTSYVNYISEVLRLHF